MNEVTFNVVNYLITLMATLGLFALPFAVYIFFNSKDNVFKGLIASFLLVDSLFVALFGYASIFGVW
mgnify:CR=1 FL=1